MDDDAKIESSHDVMVLAFRQDGRSCLRQAPKQLKPGADMEPVGRLLGVQRCSPTLPTSYIHACSEWESSGRQRRGWRTKAGLHGRIQGKHGSSRETQRALKPCDPSSSSFERPLNAQPSNSSLPIHLQSYSPSPLQAPKL